MFVCLVYRPNIPHDFEITLEVYHLVSLVEKWKFYVILLTHVIVLTYVILLTHVIVLTYVTLLTALHPNSMSYKLCTCLSTLNNCVDMVESFAHFTVF